MSYKKYEQMAFWGYQLLHWIDQGKYISVEEVCSHIEKGDVVNFISNKIKWDNTNISIEDISGVNEELKKKNISQSQAESQGVSENGLIYMMHLILEDCTNLLYNIDLDDDNDVNVETFRDL